MSIDPSILRALQAAGATTDMIIAAVEAAAVIDGARMIEKRQKDAARQRKSRASRNVTVTPSDKCDLPPNDIYSNPPSVTPSPDGDDPLAPDFSEKVVETWNRQIAGSPLPQARKLTPDRRKHLRCRVREHGEQAVFTAMTNMIQSDFHSGRSGKWTEGNLGWLLKSGENFVKMLERSPPQSAVVAELWTEERKAAMLAKWTADPPAAPPDLRPQVSDRRATAHGTPIGKLVQQNGFSR